MSTPVDVMQDLRAGQGAEEVHSITDLQTDSRLRPERQESAPIILGELQALRAMAAGVERDPGLLVRRARRTGEALSATGKALYSFPAGGGRIEGPTVQMAEALALDWGHLYTGVRIDRVDGDRVYLTGVVYDLVAGTAVTRPHVATLPPAPGKFAAKAEQAARWESMQMQSAISKAVRTAILHAIPDWFSSAAVDAAKTHTSREVLRGKTPQQAASDVFAAFAALGVSTEQVVAHVGEDPALWTASDVVDLRGVYAAIHRGETTVERVFGSRTERPTPPKSLAAQLTETTLAPGHDPPSMPTPQRQRRPRRAAQTATAAHVDVPAVPDADNDPIRAAEARDALVRDVLDEVHPAFLRSALGLPHATPLDLATIAAADATSILLSWRGPSGQSWRDAVTGHDATPQP